MTDKRTAGGVTQMQITRPVMINMLTDLPLELKILTKREISFKFPRPGIKQPGMTISTQLVLGAEQDQYTNCQTAMFTPKPA
jgi:hypothetical protein